MKFLKNIFYNYKSRKALIQWTTNDQKIMEFYSHFISPDALCFDVGANIGKRAKIFLKLGANVIALEPQVDCVKNMAMTLGKNPRLKIIQAAVGEAQGEAILMTTREKTISSISSEWIKSVKTSGRFSEYNWDKKINVPLTTLDNLIKQYGIPNFIKIDVEGYEYEVIKGLSQPVEFISLEFTPEFLESTYACIDHLSLLGEVRLNYSVEETMQLILPNWVNHKEIKFLLNQYKGNNKIFGDIYVDFINKNANQES